MPNSFNTAFTKFKNNQSWSWAFRLAITVCVPIILSLFLHNFEHTFWIVLSAQSIGFIESKGTNGHVIRNLFIATLLAGLFCVIGTVSGIHFLPHIIMMFLVGFASTMFKNLGERGMGVALSLYIFYIFTSSYPSLDTSIILDRLFYVFLGCAWGSVVTIVFMLVPKAGLGFRKSMAEVFLEMSVLSQKARAGFGGSGLFTSVRELYLQEVKIRKALNLSIELYSTSSQSDVREINEEQVQYLRKIVSLINIQFLELIDKTQRLKIYRKEGNIDVNVHSLLRLWDQIFSFMEKYIISISQEDRLLLVNRLQRLHNLLKLQYNDNIHASIEAQHLLENVHNISGRMSKLVEKYISMIEVQDERSAFKMYSFSYTLSLLHPKLFSNDWKDLFKLDVEMTKYALRVAIAVSIGFILDYLLFPNYGYWVPFTSIIVAQPYIGATIKKGIERTVGTLLGVFVGYLFMELPHGQIWNIIILFISSIFSIYFLKKQYSISTFFVTLSMIGIISLSGSDSSEGLFLTRVISTGIGAAISIGMAFLFMSSWDKSMLPIHFKQSLIHNYQYLLYSPFHFKDNASINWLRNKRIAESSNATVYDSFNRWISEPQVNKRKKKVALYFSKITHIIRITKEINNLNTEFELMNPGNADQYIYNDVDHQKLKIIHQLFHRCFIKYEVDISSLTDTFKYDHVQYYNKAQIMSLDKLIIELTALLKSKTEN